MNNELKSLINLNAWQEARILNLLVYKIANNFPKSEIFGLTSQIRRASVSVASNIAEGFSRFSKKDKKNFYIISRGSLTELQNQLVLAFDVGYLDKESFTKIIDQTTKVSKLLGGLIRSTKNPPLIPKFQIPNP